MPAAWASCNDAYAGTGSTCEHRAAQNSESPDGETVSWTEVCPMAQLAEAVPRGVTVAGVDVCLVRLGGEVFAVHDECTHESVPLSEGDVEGGAIECWRHGSQF